MTIEQTLSSLVIKAVKALYDIDAAPQQVQLQKTRPEFEGNITVVVFPFVKAARKAPAQVAAELGQWLVENGTPNSSKKAGGDAHDKSVCTTCAPGQTHADA